MAAKNKPFQTRVVDSRRASSAQLLWRQRYDKCGVKSKRLDVNSSSLFLHEPAIQMEAFDLAYNTVGSHPAVQHTCIKIKCSPGQLCFGIDPNCIEINGMAQQAVTEVVTTIQEKYSNTFV